jgi:hypothetical protein
MSDDFQGLKRLSPLEFDIRWAEQAAEKAEIVGFDSDSSGD